MRNQGSDLYHVRSVLMPLPNDLSYLRSLTAHGADCHQVRVLNQEHFCFSSAEASSRETGRSAILLEASSVFQALLIGDVLYCLCA